MEDSRVNELELSRKTEIMNSKTKVGQSELTNDQYDELSAQQGDKRAICSGVNKDGRRLFVDHDHVTGKIRGLLCHNCNSVLGFAGDSPKFLAAAIKYPEKN